MQKIMLLDWDIRHGYMKKQGGHSLDSTAARRRSRPSGVNSTTFRDFTEPFTQPCRSWGGVSKILGVQDLSGSQQTQGNDERTSCGALRTRPPDELLFTVQVRSVLRYSIALLLLVRYRKISFYSNDKFSDYGERVLRTGATVTLWQAALTRDVQDDNYGSTEHTVTCTRV